MVQSRPTLDVTTTFLSNFIKVVYGVPRVRSDSPAVRFWNAASQPTLPVRLLSTNWSRCFWMTEENNLVISDGFLWGRWNGVIAQKEVKSCSPGPSKIRFQIQFHGSCPWSWCCHSCLPERDGAASHTVSFKTCHRFSFGCRSVFWVPLKKQLIAYIMEYISAYVWNSTTVWLGILGEEWRHRLGGYINRNQVQFS